MPTNARPRSALIAFQKPYGLIGKPQIHSTLSREACPVVWLTTKVKASLEDKGLVLLILVALFKVVPLKDKGLLVPAYNTAVQGACISYPNVTMSFCLISCQVAGHSS